MLYEFVDLSICRFATIATCKLFELRKIQRLNNSVLNFVPNRQTLGVYRETPLVFDVVENYESLEPR